MREDLEIRNDSDTTRVSYFGAVARFARHFGTPPDRLGPEEIRAYQVHLVEERKVRVSLMGPHFAKDQNNPYLGIEVPVTRTSSRRATTTTSGRS